MTQTNFQDLESFKIWRVANPKTIRLKRCVGKESKENFMGNINKDVDISKVGESDMLF
jgi:hypothetical protein